MLALAARGHAREPHGSRKGVMKLGSHQQRKETQKSHQYSPQNSRQPAGRRTQRQPAGRQARTRGQQCPGTPCTRPAPTAATCSKALPQEPGGARALVSQRRFHHPGRAPRHLGPLCPAQSLPPVCAATSAAKSITRFSIPSPRTKRSKRRTWMFSPMPAICSLMCSAPKRSARGGGRGQGGRRSAVRERSGRRARQTPQQAAGTH